MRHRSPRPFLDLWRRPARPRRRGLLAVAALVVAATATGLSLAAQHEPPGEHASSAPRSTPASTPSVSAPAPLDRQRAHSRSSDRPSRTPSPTAVPSPTATTSEPSLTERATERVASHLRRALRTPSSSGTPVDRTAPVTTVRTVATTADVWTLAVAADEPATFACSLDGAAYAPCLPTTTYRGLDAGPHSMSARATDLAGNADSSPAAASTKVIPGLGGGADGG